MMLLAPLLKHIERGRLDVQRVSGFAIGRIGPEGEPLHPPQTSTTTLLSGLCRGLLGGTLTGEVSRTEQRPSSSPVIPSVASFWLNASDDRHGHVLDVQGLNQFATVYDVGPTT